MIIPDKIKLLGHTVAVVVVPSEEFEGRVVGDFNEGDVLIRIADDLPECMQAQVFLHEIVEYIVNGSLDYGLKHHIISGLGEVLFQVLRDNGLDFSDKRRMPVHGDEIEDPEQKTETVHDGEGS